MLLSEPGVPEAMIKKFNRAFVLLQKTLNHVQTIDPMTFKNRSRSHFARSRSPYATKFPRPSDYRYAVFIEESTIHKLFKQLISWPWKIGQGHHPPNLSKPRVRCICGINLNIVPLIVAKIWCAQLFYARQTDDLENKGQGQGHHTQENSPGLVTMHMQYVFGNE